MKRSLTAFVLLVAAAATGPFAWRDRPDFTCFQAGSETAAIARGVQMELGPLTNTQAKPEVGPFAGQ